MNGKLITLTFNWHNFWSVWAGLGYIVGTALWCFISAGLVFFCCVSALGDDDEMVAGCVTIPITIVWFGLSAAIYAGMH